MNCSTSANGMVRLCSCPASNKKLARGANDDKEHAMSQTVPTAIAVLGIDIGKNAFHSLATMIEARSCCVRSGRVVRWSTFLPLAHFANRG